MSTGGPDQAARPGRDHRLAILSERPPCPNLLIYTYRVAPLTYHSAMRNMNPEGS